MRFGIFFCLMIAAAFPVPVQFVRAEEVPAYCEGEEYRRLDFWVGTWKVSWGSGDQAGEGMNVITRTLGGCVIEEQFDGGITSGFHFKGMSISLYDAREKQWRQTWMDNQGGFFDFYGEDLGGDFVFQTRQSVHNPGVLRRMLFTDITPDSLTWRWQKSENLGGDWKDVWVIIYERLK